MPLRTIIEALVATVDCDGNTNTVTSVKGDTKINLCINSDQLYINGTPKTIYIFTKPINDRTMLPNDVQKLLKEGKEIKPSVKSIMDINAKLGELK